MGRGRPPVDHQPMLDDVLRYWNHAGDTFDRAVRAVITVDYVRPYNLTVKHARARVYALHRQQEFLLPIQSLLLDIELPFLQLGKFPVFQLSAEFRNVIEHMRRLGTFGRAFSDLLPPDTPLRDVQRLYFQNHALIRRANAQRRKSKAGHI